MLTDASGALRLPYRHARRLEVAHQSLSGTVDAVLILQMLRYLTHQVIPVRHGELTAALLMSALEMVHLRNLILRHQAATAMTTTAFHTTQLSDGDPVRFSS